mgnify:CR=1 FL=1
MVRKTLKTMRNFLVHAYHKIDTSIIRDTITHDIPQLREEISTIKKQSTLAQSFKHKVAY